MHRSVAEQDCLPQQCEPAYANKANANEVLSQQTSMTLIEVLIEKQPAKTLQWWKTQAL